MRGKVPIRDIDYPKSCIYGTQQRSSVGKVPDFSLSKFWAGVRIPAPPSCEEGGDYENHIPWDAIMKITSLGVQLWDPHVLSGEIPEKIIPRVI